MDTPDEQAHQAQIAGAWGRAAATYGRVGPPFFTHFGQRLVEFAALSPGDRVLDVAAGRGAVLFPAAAAVGPQGQVTGIDFAAGMVSETAAEIAARHLGQATIRQMDAEHLAFPDAAFDGVLCGFALFFFPHLDRALAEFRRVLRPGGFLAVSTWGPGDERWHWLEDLRGRNPPPRPAGAADFGSPVGLTTLLAAAGFVNVRVAAAEREFYYAGEEEWWATNWSHGARLEMERLPPEALAQGRAFAAPKIAALAQPAGIPQLFRALFARGTAPDPPAVPGPG